MGVSVSGTIDQKTYLKNLGEASAFAIWSDRDTEINSDKPFYIPDCCPTWTPTTIAPWPSDLKAEREDSEFQSK